MVGVSECVNVFSIQPYDFSPKSILPTKWRRYTGGRNEAALTGLLTQAGPGSGSWEEGPQARVSPGLD